MRTSLWSWLSATWLTIFTTLSSLKELQKLHQATFNNFNCLPYFHQHFQLFDDKPMHMCDFHRSILFRIISDRKKILLDDKVNQIFHAILNIEQALILYNQDREGISVLIEDLFVPKALTLFHFLRFWLTHLNGISMDINDHILNAFYHKFGYRVDNLQNGMHVKYVICGGNLVESCKIKVPIK